MLRGTVLSTDMKRNEITVKNDRGRDSVFIVNPGVIKTLRAGSDVIVIFREGTNVAKSIGLINPNIEA